MVNTKLVIASIVCIVIIFSGIYVVLIKDDSDTKSNSNLEQSITGEDITTKEAFDLIQNNSENPDFVILDVRTLDEYNSGHIENASMLDFYNESFRDDLDQLDKNDTYVVYCRSGNRSRSATDIMVELGFKDVYNMLGGIVQWNKDGYKIVK
jgi:rhodanese-related sulfurtransferase